MKLSWAIHFNLQQSINHLSHNSNYLKKSKFITTNCKLLRLIKPPLNCTFYTFIDFCRIHTAINHMSNVVKHFFKKEIKKIKSSRKEWNKKLWPIKNYAVKRIYYWFLRDFFIFFVGKMDWTVFELLEILNGFCTAFWPTFLWRVPINWIFHKKIFVAKSFQRFTLPKVQKPRFTKEKNPISVVH